MENLMDEIEFTGYVNQRTDELISGTAELGLPADEFKIQFSDHMFKNGFQVANVDLDEIENDFLRSLDWGV